MPDTIVRARIDGKVKEEAAAMLASIGLTVSDAFRLMMMRIAKDKAYPSNPSFPMPNDRAMKAARRGDLIKAGAPDALLASLNAGIATPAA